MLKLKTSKNPTYDLLMRAYTKTEVGYRIRLLRNSCEETQAGMANRLSSKHNTINQYENAASLPSVEMEVRLKAVYGVTIDWIRFGDVSGLKPDLIQRLEHAKLMIGDHRPEPRPADSAKRVKSMDAPIRRTKSKK